MPEYLLPLYQSRLGRADFNVCKLSSDRPNVAFHFVPAYAELSPPRRNYHYEDIVHALIRLLTPIIVASPTPNGRILVFFSSTSTVKSFAEQHRYLWHSSERSKIGLDATLAAWDAGHSRVLVGTTSLAQGLDRDDVRVVIVANVLYGHTTLTQMLGRAGRDEFHSDLFFIGPHGTNKQPPRTSPNPSIDAQHRINAETGCQRQLSMLLMDGPGLQPYCCLDGFAHRCGNCDPAGLQRVALQAVNSAQQVYSRGMQTNSQSSGSARLNVRQSTSTTSLLMSTSAHSSTSSISSFTPFSSEPKRPIEASKVSHIVYFNVLIPNHRPQIGLKPSILPPPPLSMHPLPKATPHPTAAELAGSTPTTQPSSSRPSLHSSLRPIVDRSQDARDATENRRAVSARLSNYLDALNGKCIIHFAGWDTLRDCTAYYCDDELPVAQWSDYPKFKKSFKFKNYTYCFHCGTPNDTPRNNFYQPSAHMNIAPAACEWKHLVFKSIFILWARTDVLKMQLFEAFGQGLSEMTTIEQFTEWAVEDVEGYLAPNYYNGLSLFVAFCDWHTYDDLAFAGMGFEL